MFFLEAETIASIYEAIAETDALSALSIIVRKVVDVDSAGIWLKRRGALSALTVTPDIAESTEPYFAYYQKLDPWSVAFEAIPNKVFVGSESVPERQLLATEFYNDFARHFGILSPMGTNLNLGPDLILAISTNRTARHGLLDTSDKPRLAAVADHVGRALRLRERLGLAFDGLPDRTGTAAALDEMASGLVICDGFSRVLYANAAARALEDRGVLTLRGLPPHLGAPARQKEEALRRFVFEAGAGRGGRGMRLTDVKGQRFSVLVTPLPSAVSGGFGPGKVLVTLRDERAVPSPDVPTLRALYGLSPAQAELCRSVAAGRTFEEIADERGVAVSTLRTHLAAVLLRTETRNLRDLVRLLATLPSMR